jgi:hypothetical protein
MGECAPGLLRPDELLIDPKGPTPQAAMLGQTLADCLSVMMQRSQDSHTSASFRETSAPKTVGEWAICSMSPLDERRR